MAAYLVAHVDVHDPAAYAEYAKLSEAAVRQYGGKYLVRGGAKEQLEGEPFPNRVVVVEFESMEQARKWYTSEEYAPAIKMRQACSTGRLVLVEGA